MLDHPPGERAATRPPALPVVSVEAGGTRHPFGVGDSPVVIGRSGSCDVIVPDPSVSARHLCVEIVPGQILCRDLSRYGSFVNGERFVWLVVARDVVIRFADPLTGPIVRIVLPTRPQPHQLAIGIIVPGSGGGCRRSGDHRRNRDVG